jgi:hypothetical protein
MLLRRNDQPGPVAHTGPYATETDYSFLGSKTAGA